ncbi:MAG: hypothetical protein SGI86_12185 [Deltaproteobacteria bacterium]|nr:hypothetical protein [Deltaproteobacteria bacterium]
MELNPSINAFFEAHVDRACNEAALSPARDTENYLVQLLTGYIQRNIDESPLCLRLYGALNAPPAQRRESLRDIGDTSLFLTGFFAERLENGVVGVDYYMSMGESAYGILAGQATGARHTVYAELASKFDGFVRVLASINARWNPERSPRDVVKLYERWQRTGSRWARARLAALGVTSVGGKPGGLQ